MRACADHGSHDYGQAGQEAKQAGVPQTTLDSMLTLPYNSDDALELIRENADDLALVMVEAVQVVVEAYELRALRKSHA